MEGEDGLVIGQRDARAEEAELKCKICKNTFFSKISNPYVSVVII